MSKRWVGTQEGNYSDPIGTGHTSVATVSAFPLDRLFILVLSTPEATPRDVQTTTRLPDKRAPGQNVECSRSTGLVLPDVWLERARVV